MEIVPQVEELKVYLSQQDMRDMMAAGFSDYKEFRRDRDQMERYVDNMLEEIREEHGATVEVRIHRYGPVRSGYEIKLWDTVYSYRDVRELIEFIRGVAAGFVYAGLKPKNTKV